MIEQTRRDLLLTTLATGAAAAALPGGAAAMLAGHEQDWAWLIGKWNVRHSRRRGWLNGTTDWDEFDGWVVNWPVMGGLANVDDNWLGGPGDPYRAVALRAFDPKTGDWSIWWLDGRSPGAIDVPVRGRFENGVGTFVADDVFAGKPIKMRFQWSEIAANSAHWEQAFSPDGGKSWEVNWRMAFTRQA
ncbi:MAG: DUF1579 domain-containing protein [Sphingomonas sp.]